LFRFVGLAGGDETARRLSWRMFMSEYFEGRSLLDARKYSGLY
jgi:hypothetical protein